MAIDGKVDYRHMHTVPVNLLDVFCTFFILCLNGTFDQLTNFDPPQIWDLGFLSSVSLLPHSLSFHHGGRRGRSRAPPEF